MITAVIIDDESHSSSRLQKMLSLHDTIKIVGLAEDVVGGIKTIQQKNPDLVFLDIEMPDGSGFDLLEQFQKPNFQVIFITGHNEFAIKAFEHSAIDYILKPVQEKDLSRAIEKAIYLVDRLHNVEKIELMLRSLENKEFSKLALPSMNSFEFINKKDIICCEADSNYTHVYLSDQRKLTTTNTLKKMDEILTERNFFRVHKSFIININFVKKVSKSEGGYVLMENNENIPMARRRKDEFLALLGM